MVLRSIERRSNGQFQLRGSDKRIFKFEKKRPLEKKLVIKRSSRPSCVPGSSLRSSSSPPFGKKRTCWSEYSSSVVFIAGSSQHSSRAEPKNIASKKTFGLESQTKDFCLRLLSYLAMAEEIKMKELTKKRASIKSQLTQFTTFLNIIKSCEQLSEEQLVELEIRIDKMVTIYATYDHLQGQLEYLSAKPDEQFTERELFEANYYKQLASARALLTQHRTQLANKGLRQLVDITNKNLRSLATLGLKVQHWDDIIIYLMASKLDPVTGREWGEHKNSLTELPSLETFIKFISNRCNFLETIEETNRLKQNTEHTHGKAKSFSVLTSKAKFNISCPLCRKDHYIFSCEQFKALPVAARLSKAKEFKLCLNCLRPGHLEAACPLGHCKYCKTRHNTMLHSHDNDSGTFKEHITLAGTKHENSSSHVLLSTALVRVTDHFGTPHSARVLLDNGSTANFITKDLCGMLHLPIRSVSSHVAGINSQVSTITQTCTLHLQSCDESYNVDVDCFVLPNITTHIPQTYIDLTDLQLPAGISLADPTFNIPSSIDILVGADIFWNVIGRNRIQLGGHMPTLFETKLGWLISGAIPQANTNHSVCMVTHDIHTSHIDNPTDLTRFWELDSISPKFNFTSEERACEQNFNKTTRRNADGRFVVTIPLKESPEALGSSYEMAKRRFLSLERRLDRDPILKGRYIESQRSLQQILWRSDPSLPLKTYSLNTVTYGTASAPYISTRCLSQLAKEATCTRTQHSIQHDFYVDDYLSGGDSIESTIALCRDVTSTLKSAQLNLRKWQANNAQILQAITTSTHSHTSTPSTSTQTHSDTHNTVSLSIDEPSKTLGVNWNYQTDSLTFSIHIPEHTNITITKRHILSTIAQIFDPLGIITPCIIEAKIVLQRLWMDKCSWDDEVNIDIKKQWLKFIQTLPQLNHLSIPRWVICSNSTSIEIHIFTDASEKAYGACIYIRSVACDGRIHTHLLTSKSKVAPIKSTTIPRLELCGALLGTRLCTKVLESLTLKPDQCIFWCDSMIVLGWLSASPATLKPFVRHRVSEMREGFGDYTWRYVPTKDNPADLVSRGLSAELISQSSMWWSGPTFLQTESALWPSMPNTDVNIVLPELVKSHNNINSLHISNLNSNNLFLILINNSSNYSQLKRQLAYIFRFINRCRRVHNHSPTLTNSELDFSANFIIKTVQKEMFPEEYEMLSSEHLKQQFWNRFSNEYIFYLQQRTKWTDSDGVLEEGAMVVLKEQQTPPLMWPLGRIVRLIPGRDGISRVADVKTKRGIVRRAYNTIYLLSSTPGACWNITTPGRPRAGAAGARGALDQLARAPAVSHEHCVIVHRTERALTS
uniref:SFRICE_016310 n=1 Tax=Spodoptera frugiperda TaxID=7108 RepID=A0A2H1WM60_SPOFR